MVFARHGFAHKPFMESMAFAMTQALITPAQHADLFEAGTIITGHLPAPTRHAVAEFAARPDPAAVSALRRAAVLQKAIGQQTIAVVATPDPEQLQTGDLPNLHIVQLLL